MSTWPVLPSGCPSFQSFSSSIEKEPTNTNASSLESQQDVSAINAFSDDVLYTIFSKLGDVDLRICAQVCSRWGQMANDETLWKDIVCSQRLGKKIWEESVGEVGAEPFYPNAPFYGMGREQISWKEVCKMQKNPSSFRVDNGLYGGRMVQMPEFDIFIPATINGQPTTINLVMQVFANARLPIGCSYIVPGIVAKYGDISIEKSYWVRHTWTVVDGTRKKAPEVQEGVIRESGRGLHMLIEQMICEFMEHQAGIESGYGQNPWTYTLCLETIEVDGKEPPTHAGGFQRRAPGGLHVHYIDSANENYCGAGGLRKF